MGFDRITVSLDSCPASHPPYVPRINGSSCLNLILLDSHSRRTFDFPRAHAPAQTQSVSLSTSQQLPLRELQIRGYVTMHALNIGRVAAFGRSCIKPCWVHHEGRNTNSQSPQITQTLASPYHSRIQCPSSFQSPNHYVPCPKFLILILLARDKPRTTSSLGIPHSPRSRRPQRHSAAGANAGSLHLSNHLARDCYPFYRSICTSALISARSGSLLGGEKSFGG